MTTRTFEVMKQNPIKAALTMIGSVAAVAVFFWAVEDRYVSAADFRQFQQQQQQSITELRRQMLEDKLFELQLKANEGTATNIDKAQILRIQRQLSQIR